MIHPKTFALSLVLIFTACSSDDSNDEGTNGSIDTGGSAGVGGSGDNADAGASGAGDDTNAGSGGTGGALAAGGTADGGTGGDAAGAGGDAVGAGGTGGTENTAGTGGVMGSGSSVNAVPMDYQGTPFTALTIPGRINAADYDRGGAGVAYCHATGNCGEATTGDYPQGSGPYRPPMPADAQLCSGAACDDNAGVCRMNPSKPDNTIDGDPMPAEATYLCYTTAGTWTKYTVTVAEAGAYSISGVMGVQQPAGMNISFGDDITTGDVPLAVTSTEHSGSGEGFHSWEDRANLASVTFPFAGTYLMTLTQTGRFNASSFTFEKTSQ